MPYLWILVGCYALAFIIINTKMSAQRANMVAHMKDLGGSAHNLQARFRSMMPLHKEILVRLWAPLVFSVVPAGVIAAGYFIFS